MVDVTQLSYHLLDLRVAADNGHQYRGTKEGVMMKFTTGEDLFSQPVGNFSSLNVYRPNVLVSETANATIAPGPTPTNRSDPININNFHRVHAHAHKGALWRTAKKVGVTPVGTLYE